MPVSESRTVNRIRNAEKRGGPGLAQYDQRDRLVRSANAFRQELLRRARSPADNAIIETAAIVYHKLLSQAAFVRYAGNADNSPSAELLRLTVALASAMNALGFTHNQPPVAKLEFPQLIVDRRPRSLAGLAREHQQQTGA